MDIGGAMRVASLYAAIGVDLSGLNAGLRDAHGRLGTFERSLGTLGNNLIGIGTKMTAAVTLPVVGGLGLMVKEASEFEAATNILSVAARESGASLDDLRSAALAVGRDTQLIGIDAMEAADAMTTFYKTGLTTAEIMGDLNQYLEEGTNLTGALRAAIDLAAASDLDLARSSDVVAIAMKTFGLNAEDAVRIADSFVGAADASVAEVSDLADGIYTFGPTARAFGWSLEDTNTALAVLSERGIRGAEAGTALRSMMTNIMRGTDDTEEALRTLNVTLYDQEGNMKRLPDIIEQLTVALGGYSEEQRNAFIQTLAGTYGMKAMQTFVAEGAEGWREMESAIAASASAQEVGTERTKGFAGALEQLQGAVQTFLIQAGQPFLDQYATPIVQRLTDVVNVLSTLTPAQALTLAEVAAGLAAIGPALIGIGSGLKVISAIGMKPILVAGGILALGAAIFAATDKGQEFAESLKGLDETIYQLGGADTLQTWIDIRQGIANVGRELREFATGQTLAEALGVKLGDRAAETWQAVGEAIWGHVQAGIASAVSGAWLADLLGVKVGETPAETWASIGETIWSQMGAEAGAILGAGIVAGLSSIADAPMTLLARWANALREATGAEQTEDVWGQWKNVGVKIGQNLWEGLIETVTGLPEKLRGLSGRFRAWAEGRDTVEAGERLGETIGEGLGTVVSSLLEIGWEIGKAITTGVGAILLHAPTIARFITEFAYTIGTVVGDTIAGFEAIGQAIGAGILKGLATKLLGEDIGQWLFEQLGEDAPLRKWLDAMKFGPALAIPRLIGGALPEPELSAEDARAATNEVYAKLERVWPSEMMREAFVTLGIMPATDEEAEAALEGSQDKIERAMPKPFRVPVEPAAPEHPEIMVPEGMSRLGESAGREFGTSFDSGVLGAIQNQAPAVLADVEELFRSGTIEIIVAPTADTDTAYREGVRAADAYLSGVRTRMQIAKAARAQDQMWEDMIASENRAMGWE